MCSLVSGQIIPRHNHLLDTIPSWGKTFRVSFELCINSWSTGNSAGFSGILHFTTDASCDSCALGQRIPAVFMHKDKQIQITSSIGSSWYGLNPSVNWRLRLWYRFEIKQVAEGSKVEVRGSKNHLRLTFFMFSTISLLILMDQP